MNENNVVSNSSNTFDNNMTSNGLETPNVNTTNEVGGLGTEITENSINNIEKPKQKKKTKGILVAILIILVIALIGVLAIHKYATSQNAFKVLIDNSFDYLEGNIKQSKTLSGTFSLKVNGNSNDASSNDVFKILNKVDISGNYGIDYENKIISMDIKSNYDSKELINATVYTESGNGYLYLEDLYDKYIKMELEDYDSVFERIDEKNTKIVINSIHKALNDSLKDEYFTKTTDTVNNKKVDKTTLLLNKTNCETIKKDFINALLADEEFLNSASILLEQEVSEIKDSLTDALEEELDESYESMDISIYTNNTKFVKFEISDANNNITVVKNEESYDYEIKLEDEEKIKGTVTVKEEGDNVTCTVSVSDESNQNMIEVTISSSTKYDAVIDKKDVSNSINYEEITDADTTGIYTKIMEQEGLMNFITDISNLSSTTDTYDDYDISA